MPNGPDFNGPPQLARRSGLYQTKFPALCRELPRRQARASTTCAVFATPKQEADCNVWCAPKLRIVTLTAPYFHNGLVPTLEEVVTARAKGGSNRDLSADEVRSLVAYTNAPRGELPKQIALKPP